MSERIVETGPLTGLIYNLHHPANVSLWPPAPIWWICALLLLALISWLLLFICRKNGLRLFGRTTTHATKPLAQTAQQHLQQHYSQWRKDAIATVYLEQANILLKRYVLSSNSTLNQRTVSIDKVQRNSNDTDKHSDQHSDRNADLFPMVWHGMPWVEWMQQATSTTLSIKTMQGLAIDCYRPEATATALPIAEIHPQLLQWIADYGERQHA